MPFFVLRMCWVILRVNGDHKRKWNHINEISGAFWYSSTSSPSLGLTLPHLSFTSLQSSVIRITLPLSEFVSHYHYMNPESSPSASIHPSIAVDVCTEQHVNCTMAPMSLLNDAVTKMYRIVAIKLCTRPSTMVYEAFILVYVARIAFSGKSYCVVLFGTPIYSMAFLSSLTLSKITCKWFVWPNNNRLRVVMKLR